MHSNVYDDDISLVVDPDTREIYNPDDDDAKIVLIQNDHNSERITFDIPRYIDGHDMYECNVIEVHYNNIATNGRQSIPGVYRIMDKQLDPDDDSIIHGSWLISQNATSLIGTLSFILRFACIERSAIVYQWATSPFSKIVVSDTINNSNTIVELHADVLEQWKETLFDPTRVYVEGDTLHVRNKWWEVLTVRKAAMADTATNADMAATAEKALDADNAHQASAARVAEQAATAVHATKADTADHATAADTATNADHATTADTATNADHATTADTATNAGHATSADTAEHARTADTVKTTNADYATTAGTANYATTAGTANHATTADTAIATDAKKVKVGTSNSGTKHIAIFDDVTGEYSSLSHNASCMYDASQKQLIVPNLSTTEVLAHTVECLANNGRYYDENDTNSISLTHNTGDVMDNNPGMGYLAIVRGWCNDNEGKNYVKPGTESFVLVYLPSFNVLNAANEKSAVIGRLPRAAKDGADVSIVAKIHEELGEYIVEAGDPYITTLHSVTILGVSTVLPTYNS